MKLLVQVVLLATGFFASCSPTRFVPAEMEYASIEINHEKTGENEALKNMLRPYSDSVENSMNINIGSLGGEMTKSWPECSLGAFMTDAYLQMGSDTFRQKVDFALMNMGGIRLGSLPAGTITRGRIFELMPFDNLLVLLKLNGSQVQNLLSDIAAKGGWPISGGSYTISDKKAVDIKINGKPLDPEKIYVLATSDYIANGGDESSILKNIPQISLGYLQRDALIAYVKKFASHDKMVPKTVSQNRVIRTETTYEP
jgi:2',3'-cyclic-nucleotide 2'-phosphodiesterase (5'-nucleotidase family)